MNTREGGCLGVLWQKPRRLLVGEAGQSIQHTMDVW